MERTRKANDAEESFDPQSTHDTVEEDGELSFFVRVKHDFEPTQEDQLKLR